MISYDRAFDLDKISVLYGTSKACHRVIAENCQYSFLAAVNGFGFIDEDLHEALPNNSFLRRKLYFSFRYRKDRKSNSLVVVVWHPENDLSSKQQVKVGKALVDISLLNHVKLVIVTNSPFILRAIECYTDIQDCMDILNAYQITSVTKYHTKVENVSYSGYGVSSLYEQIFLPLDELDKFLDR